MWSRFTIGSLVAVAIPTLRAEPTTVDEVLAAHRQSREAIATLTCRVQYVHRQLTEVGKFAESKHTADCWWSGDSLRVKYSGPDDRIEDMILHDSSYTVAYTHLKPDPSTVGQFGGAVSSPHRSAYSQCDPRLANGLLLWEPESLNLVEFSELVRRAKRVSKSGYRTEGGKRFYRIELVYPGSGPETIDGDWTLEFLLDPATNYLIAQDTRSARFKSGVEMHKRLTVTEFQEPKPGVHLVKKSKGTSARNGKEVVSFEYSVDAVQLNEPIPESRFRQRFNGNTLVADGVRRTSYRVDSVGQRISEEKPLSPQSNPQSTASTEVTEKPGRISTEERRSWTRWLLPASGALLFVAIVIQIWRSRASRRNQ